jgi:N-acetylglucosamine kinase-like BadF-type ATPase
MGAADMTEVFHRISTFDRMPDALEVAPLVAAAARDGDATCTALLEAHGRELGLAVATALHRLNVADASPEVVGLGGMFPMCDGTRLLPAMEEEVRRHAPTATVRVLGVEPVVGAVVAALRHAGCEPDVAQLRAQWVDKWAAR